MSFETILVRLYYNSCHYQCAFYNTYQNWWIFVYPFYYRRGKRCNIFGILCFIISRNVSNWNPEKICALHWKVLWLIRHVRSGWQSSMLEISHRWWSSWSWQYSNQDINWEQSCCMMTQIATVRIPKWSIQNHCSFGLC